MPTEVVVIFAAFSAAAHSFVCTLRVAATCWIVWLFRKQKIKSINPTTGEVTFAEIEKK